MSFRIENKYIIDPTKIIFFKKWLNDKKFNIKYPKRRVTSLYLDNKNLVSYKDSIEGIVPRKKIRIRYYGEINSKTKYLLEKKISSIEGRYKVSKMISESKKDRILRYGLIDKEYGNCKLSKIISYNRSYYYLDNFRLTFDENINFKKSIYSLNWQKIPINLFEIKTNINTSEDNINLIIPFEKRRFSKYCETF
tara:strand:- start:4655 stop:5236 length:582 start_codon:yes stop_codon:yes gene_type:complete